MLSATCQQQGGTALGTQGGFGHPARDAPWDRRTESLTPGLLLGEDPPIKGIRSLCNWYSALTLCQALGHKGGQRQTQPCPRLPGEKCHQPHKHANKCTT